MAALVATLRVALYADYSITGDYRCGSVCSDYQDTGFQSRNRAFSHAQRGWLMHALPRLQAWQTRAPSCGVASNVEPTPPTPPALLVLRASRPSSRACSERTKARTVLCCAVLYCSHARHIVGPSTAIRMKLQSGTCPFSVGFLGKNTIPYAGVMAFCRNLSATTSIQATEINENYERG